MEFDTTNFNAEEIAKVNELIDSIKKEKEKESKKKWWIVPTNTPLFNNDEYQRFGSCYYVAEQKESYPKCCPPLKSDFNSKEEAEEWLKNYLNEEKLFNSAIENIDNLACNLGIIRNKLKNHYMISDDDWTECFKMFNESRINGELAEVTK